MSILTQSMDWVRRACDVLFTQDCLLCGMASGAQMICAACAADLPRLPARHCVQCALPMPSGERAEGGEASHRCGRCLTKPPHYDATVAAFLYDFPIDKLVQSLKYTHRLALSTYLGRQLATLGEDCAVDLLIPLPLHPQRLRERGFNQALELARSIAAARGWPLDTRSCTRIRHTTAQVRLPWRERAKNIRGAFHCTVDLHGKHIALVDDVMTTGASLDECARVLKLHGAASVTAIVLARALPRSQRLT